MWNQSEDLLIIIMGLKTTNDEDEITNNDEEQTSCCSRLRQTQTASLVISVRCVLTNLSLCNSDGLSVCFFYNRFKL